jgi:ribosomal-protein-alanine N-acetyltransferase
MTQPSVATLQVRRFLPSDSARLSEIAAQSPQASYWSPESYASLAASPSGLVLLAETKSESTARSVVNAFLAARHAAGEAEILNLAIDSKARRKGAASALLTAALTEFHASGVRRIFLEVRESNHPAISLYEKHGFIRSSRRKQYYKNPIEDALVLEKKLATPLL